MQSYTRRQLKHDKFAETAQETYSWALGHSKGVAITAIAIVLLALAMAGGWYYYNQRNQQASEHLGKALRVYDATLRPAGTPAQPGEPSFTSVAERASAAHSEFENIVSNYPHTPAGRIARYFSAITAIQTGDITGAESTLRDIARNGNRDLSSLAKFSLASLDRFSGHEDESIRLYKEIIDKPSNAVPKVTAQLELASLYEARQPGEAVKIYEQIQSDDKNAKAKAEAQSKKGKGSITNAANDDIEVIPAVAVEQASTRLAALKSNSPGGAAPAQAGPTPSF